MLQKKISMLGAFSVGKTSLVRQYVESIFSEKYLTTLGVKVDKKIVTVNSTEVKLLLWDLAGEDNYCSLNQSYLRGSAGFILVIDGTRPNTAAIAEEMVRTILQPNYANAPVVVALNKSDLTHEWRITDQQLQFVEEFGFPLIATSAKLDLGVEDLFTALVTGILTAS